MMMTRAFVDDFCRYAVVRGWLTSRAAGKAGLLCELGLHPQQAFVGTGLLSADAYEDALSHVDDPSFRVEAIQESPALSPPEIRATRLLRVILAAAKAARTHHIYLEQSPRGSEVILSHDIRRDPSLAFSAGPFSALRMRARRFAAASGWTVEEKEKGNGFTMILSRPLFASSVPHALDASDAWQSFWKNPEGLCVLQGRDPAWRQAMRSAPESVWCMEADDADAREEALHAALAGKTVLAHAPSSAEPWWEAGAEAGIPVRVLTARQHADGTSWEAHQLSEADIL